MDRPTTRDVYAAIRKRYEAPAWALMFEVADATGARHTRWADAVAMGLWPSRGIHMHGMEVKSSRTDWVKELKTPAKAESICKYCDYWWLVVSDSSIVKDGELPANWGLLVLNGKDVLKTVKAAPKLTPVPITADFLAALMRSATSPSNRGQANLEQKAYWRGKEDAEKRLKESDARVEVKLNELAKKVADFEQAAGFHLDNYMIRAGDRGKLVREVLNGYYDRDRDELKNMRDVALKIVAHIDESRVLEVKELEPA